MGSDVPKARCVHCRSDVLVPASYAHGDHIKCGGCGTQHKVSRGDVVRLVLADVTPLHDALRANEQMVDRLEADLRVARGSFGVGVNGFGVGVVYALWQVARNEQPWSGSLLAKAIAIAIVSGVILEAINYFFLAKRQQITRLSAEIEAADEESQRLRQQIRETSRL
ncbi:MAG TPA: hypothetical protein VN461_10495 [Vicinamibacteria bacterium]|jgi:hypothetical protein|nr:hypothetical protein [Vicinamibacteria bacterium]